LFGLILSNKSITCFRILTVLSTLTLLTLLTIFPTTLEVLVPTPERPAPTPPPKPPARSKIISPLFAYCFQLSPVPPIAPSVKILS
jgi:hypothetical protein